MWKKHYILKLGLRLNESMSNILKYPSSRRVHGPAFSVGNRKNGDKRHGTILPVGKRYDIKFSKYYIFKKI
jgi:hypothetical protein